MTENWESVLGIEDHLNASARGDRKLRTGQPRPTAPLQSHHLQEILDTSPVGVGIVRVWDGKVLYTNKRIAEIRGEAIGKEGSETFKDSATSYWADPKEFDKCLAIYKKHNRLPSIEVELKRMDDRTYPALTSWETIYVHDDKCILYWVHDLTVQKNTEAELARKEQLATLGQLEVFNQIAEELHRSTDVMTVAKRATEVIQQYAGNPSAAISMLNEEKQTLDLLYSTDSRAPVKRAGAELPLSMSISGEAVTTQRVISCKNLTKDSRLHPAIKAKLLEDGYVSSVSIPLVYQDRTLGVMNLLFRDWYTISDREKETLGALGKTIGLAISNAIHVTQINQEVVERNTLEAQLQQAQKIESIGQLAGGIAHDFNNLLVVISGYSQMLLDDKTLSERGQTFALEIANAGDRAANLTRQLLTFGRRQAMHRNPVNVDELLTGVQGMFSRLIPENIEQVFRIEPNLPNISADRGHIEQVLVNLAVNGRDAMPDGGTLTFVAESVELDAHFVKYHPGLTVGAHVLIRVMDTGTGMSPETMQKIFEPFYTTKPEGEGTGLGLSVVFGIVGRHNGHIRVESEVGIGTEFLVYLPTTNLALRDSKDLEAPVRKQRTKTILLVEDDIQVREFAQKVLNLNGFTVLVAEDGEAGVNQYETHQDQIDMIVSDVVMPRMGGSEMIEQLWKKGYNIPVLFTSGYTPDSAHEDFLLAHSFTQIDKPYTPDNLIEKVEETLKIAAR